MGNSGSVPNSISIIKTEGDQISGVSLIYNKEDENKLISQIHEILDTQTEVLNTNNKTDIGLDKIRDVLVAPTEDFSSIREEYGNLQEEHEEHEEHEKEKKEEQKEQEEQIIKKIKESLDEKSE